MRRRRGTGFFKVPAGWWAGTILLLPLLTESIASSAALPGLPGTIVGPNALARVVYTSPVAGARYVHPETNLIVRFDRPLDAAAGLPALAAHGAQSGDCGGRARLADDGRTLLLQPGRPFAPGERVTVTLDGRTLLAFTTASARPIALGRTVPPGSDALTRLIGRAMLPLAPAATADTIPLDYPTVSSSIYGTPAPGRLFLASFSLTGRTSPYLLILDDTGQAIFYRQMAAPCTDFKVQPDGRLTYYDSNGGKFYAMDTTYAVVDSFACGNGYATDLHELRILPNGHALLLGDDPETVDMRAIVPGGDSAATVVGIVVQELDTNKNVVFEWRTFDHFQITDATHEDLTANYIDYVHSNALEVDGDGNLILSSRHMDEITKLDRTTGDILWRWGGKNNQFTLLGDTLWFSHQHAVRRLPNGNVTLFDNGNYHVPQYSRAVEYEVDEAARTARRVWEFRNTPDSYGYAMGYVQRLGNGATLIGWGMGKPDVIEVGPAGEKVLEMSLPTGQSSYRAYRLAWMSDQAGVGNPPPPGLALSVNEPNPFRGTTDLFLSLPTATTVSCQVFDLAGRRVRDVLDRTPQGPGVFRIGLDLGPNPSGVYFVRVEAAGKVVSRRIVKLD